MFKWADLSWVDSNLPFSNNFNDLYYTAYGWQESCYVSLLQSSLFEGRVSGYTPFVMAEVGFGSGLNFLVTADLWCAKNYEDSALVYISFEKQPMKPEDLSRSLSRWSENKAFKNKIIDAYQNLVPGLNVRYFPDENITLILIIADIKEGLSQTDFKADHWLLDGFDPRKNQACWNLEVLREITQSSAPKATFGTFSARGQLRRDLEALGWSITKIKGFAKKRHCMKGFLPSSSPRVPQKKLSVLVTGNGISAHACRYFLSQLKANVTGESTSPMQASDVPYIEGYPAFHSHLCDYTLVNLRAWSFATDFYSSLSKSVGLKVVKGLYRSVKGVNQRAKLLKCLKQPFYQRYFSLESDGRFFYPSAFSAYSADILTYLRESTNLTKTASVTVKSYLELKNNHDLVLLADSLRATQLETNLPYPYLLRGQLDSSMDKGKIHWHSPTADRQCFNPHPHVPQTSLERPLTQYVGFRAHLNNHLPLIGKYGRDHRDRIHVNLYHGSRGFSTGLYGGLISALEALGIFTYKQSLPCP